MWKEIDENKIKYSRTKFEDFYNLFSGVATTGVPCAKEGEWMKWCANNSSLIWDVMADEVKDFYVLIMISEIIYVFRGNHTH